MKMIFSVRIMAENRMKTEKFDISGYMEEMKEIVEGSLIDMLSPVRERVPDRLYEAMTYSLMAGGKRFRPILFLSAYRVVERDIKAALPYAVAVEYIHTYSLIHDDLPSMDDDDFRRGQPACHRVFGEAMAILAGDALLTEAFRIFLEDRDDGIPPERRMKAAFKVAMAAGAGGMVGGQSLDVMLESAEVTESDVRRIHESKTGALISASVVSAGILAGADEETISRLSEYGRKLGLAFQIVDDILDVKSSFREMGKKTGKDVKAGKVTYPSVVGLKRSEEEAEALISGARMDVETLGNCSEALSAIASLCITRRR